MSEHPLLFRQPTSDAMVRAVLDGSKTMFRVPIKPQPGNNNRITRAGRTVNICDPKVIELSPFGVGDTLWLQEAWRPYWNGDLYACVQYRADNQMRKPDFDPPYNEAHRFVEMCDKSRDDDEPWRPSIHMPRWASRISLTITDIRAEPVQSISNEDARAEGIEDAAWWDFEDWASNVEAGARTTIRDYFGQKWDSIYNRKPDAELRFDANPWVWAITFNQGVET